VASLLTGKNLTYSISKTKVSLQSYKAFSDGQRFIVNQGGSRCFYGNQLVVTRNGSKPISDITKADEVLTPNGYKKVLDTHKMANTKPSIKIKLKNGKIIQCTEDHEFYFKGDWVSIKHILSLWDEESKKL